MLNHHHLNLFLFFLLPIWLYVNSTLFYGSIFIVIIPFGRLCHAIVGGVRRILCVGRIKRLWGCDLMVSSGFCLFGLIQMGVTYLHKSNLTYLFAFYTIPEKYFPWFTSNNQFHFLRNPMHTRNFRLIPQQRHLLNKLLIARFRQFINIHTPRIKSPSKNIILHSINKHNLNITRIR